MHAFGLDHRLGGAGNRRAGRDILGAIRPALGAEMRGQCGKTLVGNLGLSRLQGQVGL